MPTPSRAILCGGQPATSTPLMRTDPALGRSTPSMHFITVDLPEPFGPISPRISPDATEKLMSRAAAQAAVAISTASRLPANVHAAPRGPLARPMSPPGKISTTTSATAETMKVARSPKRAQQFAGADEEDRAQRAAQNGAPPAEHGADDHLHADRHVDERPHARRAEVEHHQRARQPGEQSRDDEARQLMLDDIEAERARLHRVLPGGLQDEPDRRARQAIEHEPAKGHEAERDPVIDLVVGADDVGHGEADLAAGEIGEHDDEILQHQHRDERRQAEIGAAHAQRRQRQHDAANNGGERAGGDAERERRLIEIVENAGGVGAEPDQKRRAEIDLVGEAEQQVPRHREHAEVIGRGQQAENVAGDPQRQERETEADDERDEDGGEGAAGHRRPPPFPSLRAQRSNPALP